MTTDVNCHTLNWLNLDIHLLSLGFVNFNDNKCYINDSWHSADFFKTLSITDVQMVFSLLKE